MAIFKQKAPNSGFEILKSALADLELQSNALAMGGTALEISEPIPAYVLDLPDAAAGDIPANARQVGWRYVMKNPDGSLATADLDAEADDETSFNKITEGPIVDRFGRALEVAEETFGSANDDIEIRVLDVPSVNMAAIWMQASNRIAFIPFLDERRIKGDEPTIDQEFPVNVKRRALEILSSNTS